MSTPNQTNGKKCISNNNSATSTPSNTPVSTMSNPSSNQCGTLVPNRIFVGGISANTTEAELMQLFNNYGTVKAAKIVQDRAGVSKGYGFITFESEEEAKRLQRESDNIVLRERKLNIAPAIKRQTFSRVFDVSNTPTIAPSGPTQYYIQTGGVPFYQGGVTYYAQPQLPQPGDMAQQPTVYQAPAVYPPQSAGPPQNTAYPPIVYPSQPMYMPQQYPYQPVPYEYNYHTNGNPQFIVGNQNAHQSPPLQLQSPGSPPRTPCYNSQLSYGSDVMYFNMPLYGAMDNTAVYQEPADVASGSLGEHTSYPILLEVDASPATSHNQSTSDLESITDATRQSATPVVSLLSLGEQQEKDLSSFQGGHRKYYDDTSVNNNYLPFNAQYYSTYPHLNEYNNTYSEINNSVSYTPSVKEYHRSRPMHHTNGTHRNYNNNIVKPTWYSGRYRHNGETNENSKYNRTSSGLGTVHNGEKANDTRLTSYSPHSHRGNVNNRSWTRNFENSNRSGRGRFSNRYCNNYRNNTSAEFTTERTNSVRKYNNTTNDLTVVDSADHKLSIADDVATLDSSRPPFYLPSPFPPQMNQSSQNCVSSTRKGRRNVRRSTHMGAPMTEIGAGDAPIPSPDVGDTCKKLDNLKL